VTDPQVKTGRRLLLAFFLIYVIYLWPVPAVMTLRQLYLARALSEGHITLDAYALRSGDVVSIGSHVYPSTPPLMGLAGAPVVLAAKATGLVASAPVAWSLGDEVRALIPFTALFSAFAGACAVALVHRGLRARGHDERAALLGALALGLATPLFPYATIAYDEALACALVALAVAALAESAFSIAGLALGLAVLASYHALWAAAGLGLAVLAGAGFRPAVRLGLGALGPVLIMLAFNVATTGHLLESPDTHFTIDGEHVGGVPWRIPSLRALFHLTIGPWKGLFAFWPILAVGAFGLGVEAREAGGGRWLARALLFAAGLVFLANSAIPMRGTTSWASWESLGPRYSVVAVPLLAFGIPAGLARLPRLARAAVVLVSFGSAWAGAQTSWQFSIHESWLELLALGPRLRAVYVVRGLFAPGSDAEGAAVLAAVVAVPVVAGAVLWILRPSLPKGRWLRLWALGSLLHAGLALPWLLCERGHEEELRRAAVRRSYIRGGNATDSAMRLVYVANELVEAGDNGEARAALERAVVLEPGNADVLAGAVRIFRDMNDHSREGTLAVKLHALRPDDVEVAITFADSVWARGDRETATKLWRAILAARPDVARRPTLQAHLAALGLR
jgi:hypothetical protein